MKIQSKIIRYGLKFHRNCVSGREGTELGKNVNRAVSCMKIDILNRRFVTQHRKKPRSPTKYYSLNISYSLNSRRCYSFLNKLQPGVAITPATQKAKIRKIMVQGQSGQS
jgi:hypothetical protein